MKRPLDPVLCLNAALVLILSEIVLLTATQTFTFGSGRGVWVYGYIFTFHWRPLFLGIGLSLVLVPLVIISLRLIDRYQFARYQFAIVTLWLLIGVAGQITLHQPYAYSIDDVVRSQYGNSFYLESLRLSAHDMLSGYEAVAASLPRHLQANMPGKLLFYKGLEWITSDPRTLGPLIIVISSLGGVLLYLIVLEIYQSRTVALSSFVLYLFIPSKIYFTPLLNIVSGIPILACLLLLLYFLKSRRRFVALFLGPLLYASLFFEPLPPVFVAPILAAFAARAWWLGKVTIADLLLLAGLSAAGFAAVYLIMYFGFHFEVVHRLVGMWQDANHFNRSLGRPYFLWLWLNLAEFFLTAGILASVLCLLYVTISVIEAAGALRARSLIGHTLRAMLEPGPLMFAAFLFALGILDLVGNRGESERIWIFMMTFVQIVAAGFACERGNRWTVGILLGGSIIQTAVTISMVAFIL